MGGERSDRPGRPIDSRPLVETAVVTASTRDLEIVVHGLVVPRRKILVAAQIAGPSMGMLAQHWQMRLSCVLCGSHSLRESNP